jgi:hypothetical protein
MRILKKELWPHRISVGAENWDNDSVIDREHWLGEKMGPLKGRWNVVYNHNKTDYYFKSGSDATMFSLKWA